MTSSFPPSANQPTGQEAGLFTLAYKRDSSTMAVPVDEAELRQRLRHADDLHQIEVERQRLRLQRDEADQAQNHSHRDIRFVIGITMGSVGFLGAIMTLMVLLTAAWGMRVTQSWEQLAHLSLPICAILAILGGTITFTLRQPALTPGTPLALTRLLSSSRVKANDQAPASKDA